MKSSLISVSVWVYIWLFNRYTLVARRLIRNSLILDLTLAISNSIFSDPIFQYLEYNIYIYRVPKKTEFSGNWLWQIHLKYW